MKRLALSSLRAVLFTVLALPLACDGASSGNGDDAGTPQVTFCQDRVDDNGDDLDENCPATLPRDAPPVFDCEGAAPAAVLAHAKLGPNEQVEHGCVYVYEGETGAFYAAVDVEDGSFPLGPMGPQSNLCGYDHNARRHVFMTSAPSADCSDLVYQHPDMTQNQLLSNDCRKMLRNVGLTDFRFDPNIQFLDGVLDAQLYRLDTFGVVELACIGINGTDGEPYRPDEVFVVQASAAWEMNAAFTPR